MENLKNLIPVSENLATTPFSERGNLTAPQHEILSEDLASFLVAHYILVAKNPSVSSVKEHFSSAPELAEVVERLLFQLEKEGLITVDGDKLTSRNDIADLGGDAKNLLRFMPAPFLARGRAHFARFPKR